ncbi:hypothetical protein FZZ93_18050 [Halomonas eurihalina]|uniref:Uncharacterized protein n=1 Tax=Halomonas eurihalina TaxID=42566 RepID=A0A5D9CHA6_HALER|nr:hypothetical protein [Halomonas eurihalina]MDR5860466.1 hypothetical protein [Halomonas eurihalina]TZG30757.1 hypothetical protein FZZ93_18050 [Halomonas eurihalina]
MTDAVQPEGYEETAFTAERIPRQAPPPPKGKLGKLGDAFDVARLPWGNYIGINPSEFEYENKIGWMRSYKYMGEKDYHDYNMINESRWSQFVDEDISLIYRFLRFWFVVLTHFFSFIGGAGWFVTGVVAVCTILFLFAADTILAALTPLAIVVAVCGLCTVLRRLFETQSIRFYKSNKNWSDDVAFCRRSGLVKSFQGNFPFYEFDAFIEMSADMKGNQYHTLKVRHRYPQFSKDNRSGLPLEFTFPTDTGSIAERYAMWDMLSRFMDVSQPLPDIPRLEPFRHLDPTTRAYDEAGKRGRPATYWRDLYAKVDEKELTRLRWEHHEKVNAAPWGSRPDLMAQSVPGYENSYTAEPEDVNAYAHAPTKNVRFVERPDAASSESSSDQQNTQR